jgi:hypothetical protein
MLVLLFAMALTDVQQAHHDEIEQAIYKRIEADRAAISDIWPAESQAAGRLHQSSHLLRGASSLPRSNLRYGPYPSRKRPR